MNPHEESDYRTYALLRCFKVHHGKFWAGRALEDFYRMLNRVRTDAMEALADALLRDDPLPDPRKFADTMVDEANKLRG